MSQDISPEDYQKFASKYPELAPIGINNLGPKIWILFNALQDQSVSISSISHRPCASLMENNVSFENIEYILKELSANNLLKYVSGSASYRLDDKMAYALQQLSFDLTRQLPSTSEDMATLLQDCGYSTEFTTHGALTPLFSDDNNVKSTKFRELLSEVAFSGLRLIIKLMNRTEESIT